MISKLGTPFITNEAHSNLVFNKLKYGIVKKKAKAKRFLVDTKLKQKKRTR